MRKLPCNVFIAFNFLLLKIMGSQPVNKSNTQLDLYTNLNKPPIQNEPKRSPENKRKVVNDQRKKDETKVVTTYANKATASLNILTGKK